ncbi:glycerol-3-phosphate dehydrogenase/oxidase [Evansella tamaricis]|uniref:Aerobic glycerol-3-phosphate dehydrogenase n=1 Tax=Evansella tamaricis TaxID=2069301 RepID=A0ABS6JHP0_9BACI|nr:glycerol-3-phosphate dehydrogenase/oxidase [Evansella tamaricis]MBU9713151.1 glycerol-3-phosphate dehydrogenase/oxidase [Evansella tamaricis]
MFSARKRKEYLGKLSAQELDVLIIGGGITGAGIALDSVTRGFSTGLVEMQDFAAGTSSRSTKLVHGGLRYLKQLEVKLVAEVGKERAIVYENAPHVTSPEWMLLPLMKGGTFGKFSTSIGLKVYDFLAGVRRTERRRMLTREETLEREPLLRKDGLIGGGIYVEYKTDDARLTLEILKESVSRGVNAVNYAKVEKFIYENGKVTGVSVRDVISGEIYVIYAKKIVNATGPWVDTLREEDRSKEGKSLYLTKGVHIVVDQSRFPLKQAVYFDTEGDGRMIFAIPRDGKAYIGTTDTYYEDDYVSPRMNKKDLDYLLDAANFMFPEVNLTELDVESSWAGLRPLIHEEGKRASEISRKDEVFVSRSGLISIAGGKLTGYRKMAEKIVNILCKELHNEKKCKTEKLLLSGGEVGGSSNLESFIQECINKGVELGLEEKEARRLTRLYGSNISKVYDIIKYSSEEAKQFHLPVGLYASLVYGIEEEMVNTPIDFFNRRTGSLFFNICMVKENQDAVIELMSNRLQWTLEMKEDYQRQLENEIFYSENTEELPNLREKSYDKQLFQN